jgi:hypothetical protein
MADSIFKGTVFFACRNYGWTENWWIEATTYATALGSLTNIAQARLPMMTPDCSIPAMRVSLPGTKGASFNNIAPNVGTFTSPNGTTTAFTALLISLRGGDIYKAQHYLHGIPDQEEVSGQYAPDATFLSAYNTFASVVRANAVMYGKNRNPPPAAKVVIPITLVVAERLVEHKVGRPFGSPHGRSATG